ncbi:MAG: MaoC/PaaZ C-terminal domain-containing protein, partial [Planctomycetota bacterium]
RLHSEDLEVGQSWRSPLRTISQADVIEFARLTGDDDPLHRIDSENESTIDDDAARSPFGKPVAHGLLGLGVLAGLGVRYPHAATLALVGIEDWQFDNPVYIDQQVRVETTIESITPYGRRASRVVWLRRLIDDDGRQLQHGRFITLVATRGVNPRRPR